jgi:hypothetical protein
MVKEKIMPIFDKCHKKSTIFVNITIYRFLHKQ